MPILQARRASYTIITKAKTNQFPTDIQLHPFDVCILPILLYGCEVWGFANLQTVYSKSNREC